MKEKSSWEVEVEKIEVCNQRQDSVLHQLYDLVSIANKLGFYDAADVINDVIKSK